MAKTLNVLKIAQTQAVEHHSIRSSLSSMYFDVFHIIIPSGFVHHGQLVCDDRSKALNAATTIQQ